MRCVIGADFDYLEESTVLLVQLFRECLSEEGSCRRGAAASLPMNIMISLGTSSAPNSRAVLTASCTHQILPAKGRRL